MKNNTEDFTVYFGNMNPKEEKMESYFSTKHARAVEIGRNRFSAGYQLDWDGEEKTVENIKEKWMKKYREKRKNPGNDKNPVNVKSVHRLADDVEKGDLIVVPPFGKDDPMRLVGIFTEEPLKYGSDLEESTDTVNYRTLEEWIPINLDEQGGLSNEFQETYAQQVIEEPELPKEDKIELLGIISSKK